MSPSLTLRACEVCRRRDGLLRCSGCQSVYYCGRDHQAADRGGHKAGCVAVKRARVRVRREEHMLRDHPRGNVFDSGVGRFWGIFETRPYMRARFGLVGVLLQHFGSAGGRVHVVQAALDHLLDLLRLCRSDNMGLRDLVPALYVRLNRDQAAYDFLKWYATTGQDSGYDWRDTQLPFLDVKDANVLEPLRGLWTEKPCLELSHAVTVALLKMRVLLDLRAVQNASRTLRGTVPPEIVDLIRARLVGTVVGSRPQILRGAAEDVAPLVLEMKCQVRQLYRSIDRSNPYFWQSMLVNPAKAIAARPQAYSQGTREEACLMLSYTYAAWVETPGAVDMVRTLSAAS